MVKCPPKPLVKGTAPWLQLQVWCQIWWASEPILPSAWGPRLASTACSWASCKQPLWLQSNGPGCCVVTNRVWRKLKEDKDHHGLNEELKFTSESSLESNLAECRKKIKGIILIACVSSLLEFYHIATIINLCAPFRTHLLWGSAASLLCLASYDRGSTHTPNDTPIFHPLGHRFSSGLLRLVCLLWARHLRWRTSAYTHAMYTNHTTFCY